MAATPAGPSVFVNCPYDEDYRKRLLHPLLFTLLWGGATPRIAIERSDSGEQRMAKICELIEAADYTLHDLTRARAEKAGEAQRMNMPFELGVVYGYRRYAGGAAGAQRSLVMVQTDADATEAISDFGGMDAKCHGGRPQTLIRVVRNWLLDTAEVQGLAPARAIWDHFQFFNESFYVDRSFEGYDNEDIYDMPVVERLGFMEEWIGKAK